MFGWKKLKGLLGKAFGSAGKPAPQADTRTRIQISGDKVVALLDEALAQAKNQGTGTRLNVVSTTPKTVLLTLTGLHQDEIADILAHAACKHANYMDIMQPHETSKRHVKPVFFDKAARDKFVVDLEALAKAANKPQAMEKIRDEAGPVLAWRANLDGYIFMRLDLEKGKLALDIDRIAVHAGHPLIEGVNNYEGVHVIPIEHAWHSAQGKRYTDGSEIVLKTEQGRKQVKDALRLLPVIDEAIQEPKKPRRRPNDRSSEGGAPEGPRF